MVSKPDHPFYLKKNHRSDGISGLALGQVHEQFVQAMT